jgi:putative ABC transport system permease protein
MNALTLFRLLSWQHIRRHPVRTLFICLIVAFGTLLIYASVSNIVNSDRARITGNSILTGRANLVLNAENAEIDPSLFETLRQNPAIQVVAPLVVDAALVIESREIITLWGIDQSIDQNLRDYRLLEGQFVSNAGEILITLSYAEHSGYGLGDSIALIGRRGIRSYTVAGIIAREGVASLNGGDIFVLGYVDVQDFRGDSNFNSLALLVAPEEKVSLLSTLSLPEGVSLQDPALLGERNLVNYVLDSLVLVTNALPAFLGALMMSNTIAASIAQRRKELAIIRAIGATKGQVLWLFLVEAALLGLIGALLGWLLALLFDNGASTSATVGDFEAVVTSSVPFWGHLWTLATGTLICVAATWWPARRIMQIDPTEAMSKPAGESDAVHYSKWRYSFGLLCLSLVVGARLAFDNSALAPLPVIISIIGTGIAAFLLFPPLLLWVSQHIAPLMNRIFGFSGAMAAENLAKRHRHASASGLIVLIVVWFWALSAPLSSGQSNFVTNFLEHEYTWDLIISGAGQDANSPISPIPVDLIESLRARSDIANFVIERKFSINYNNTEMQIRAIDTEAFSNGGGEFYWESGDNSLLPQLQNSAEPVLLSSGFNALLLGLRQAGQSISLNTPQGTVEFQIVGTILEPGEGAFIMDYQSYQSYWGDNTVDSIRLNLVEGADVAAVRRELQNAYLLRGIYVADSQELKAILTTTPGAEFFAAGLLLPFMVLGLANMLFIAVLDRQRELGMLRAIGSLRRQISLCIVLEAFIITCFAGIIALPTTVFTFETMLFQRITSMSLDLSFGGILSIIALSIIIGTFAAYLPARRAARLEILETLRYE